MNAKKKILGIFVCMLMLMTIPLAAGMTVDSEPEDPETIGDFRGISGFIFNYKEHSDGSCTFFAIKVGYVIYTDLGTMSGIWRMEPVRLPFHLMIRGFGYCGPFGMFGYIRYIFRGPF